MICWKKVIQFRFSKWQKPNNGHTTGTCGDTSGICKWILIVANSRAYLPGARNHATTHTRTLSTVCCVGLYKWKHILISHPKNFSNIVGRVDYTDRCWWFKYKVSIYSTYHQTIVHNRHVWESLSDHLFYSTLYEHS